MSDDVTIPRETAREWAAFIRNNCGGGRLAGLDDLADLLDESPPADVSVTDAEHLSRAEARLDTISPVIAIDPAMGVNITEQIKTLFQVVAKSPSHGSAIAPCDCLICSAVHSLADTILSTPVPTPPAPSLRDEVAVSYRDEIIGVTRDSWDEVADHAKVRAYEFADVVIAAFLRRVEALPMRRDYGDSYRRDDVLGLLGGDDE